MADCQHEGRGFVTEAVTAILDMAFDHMGAHRISLRTDETNTRSRLVAQRCGFVLEGRIRDAHRHSDGSVTSELLYGLLGEEHTKQRGWVDLALDGLAEIGERLDCRTTAAHLRAGPMNGQSGDVGP